MKDHLEVIAGDDFVTMLLKVSYARYNAGDITKDTLVKLMKMAVNCRAAENGYAAEFGMPFQDKDLE